MIFPAPAVCVSYSASTWNLVLYHDIEGGRQHVEASAAQREHFAIHHDVHGSIAMEINALRRPPFGQAMVDVRTVIEPRQIADQPEAPDRAPAHVFDQSIVDLSFGSNHHGAAGVLAIAEGQEQARSS